MVKTYKHWEFSLLVFGMLTKKRRKDNDFIFTSRSLFERIHLEKHNSLLTKLAKKKSTIILIYLFALFQIFIMFEVKRLNFRSRYINLF